MTLAYLRSQQERGALVEKNEDGSYRMRFADGSEIPNAVFSRREAACSESQLVSIEDSRVRAMLEELPAYAPGQPIPAVVVPGVSDKVTGTWSLWRIGLETAEGRKQRTLAIFLTDDGSVLLPTARAVWDHLIADTAATASVASSGDAWDAESVFQASRNAAEEKGAALYQELEAEHQNRLKRERAKGRHAFEARRRAIHRVGLPQVRDHRLRQLAGDKRAWEDRMAEQERAVPELAPILLLRVVSDGGIS